MSEDPCRGRICESGKKCVTDICSSAGFACVATSSMFFFFFNGSLFLFYIIYIQLILSAQTFRTTTKCPANLPSLTCETSKLCSQVTCQGGYKCVADTCGGCFTKCISACPVEKPPVTCLINPCQLISCSHGTSCVVNYCGDCTAKCIGRGLRN